MIFNLSARQANIAGLIACIGMMAYALYSQHMLGLDPCPLCVFQRVSTVALGIVFLMAALHNPGALGRRVYALLILVAAGSGIGVAGRHVWLQNLPPDQVPACGPGLDFMLDTFPMFEVLDLVLSGSGECASVSWQFLGLSMPAWVLICFVVLALWGVGSNLVAGSAHRN